jgi:hypothetical protein
MENIRNNTVRKAKIKMGGRREKRSRKNRNEKLETEGAEEEIRGRNNLSSKNS